MGYPRVKALFLGATILALFVVIGAVVGEYLFGNWLAGLAIALGISLALNLVTYFACDRIILWSTRAQVVTPAEAPRLGRIVHELAPRFGLVAPRLAILPTSTPNAFTAGRDEHHALVAATEGLMRTMNDRELTAVLAHEMAHIKDRDVLVMTFVATLAGAISYAAQMVFFSMFFGGGGSNRSGVNPLVLLLALVTAPLAAILVQLAISRSRELRADEVGARTLGDPGALADALEKLEASNQVRPMNLGSPAHAGLYIVNPFRGAAIARLFSTHPPIEERIRRLRSMARDPSYRIVVRSPVYPRAA
jgi:heat shock protein HtpX